MRDADAHPAGQPKRELAHRHLDLHLRAGAPGAAEVEHDLCPRRPRTRSRSHRLLPRPMTESSAAPALKAGAAAPRRHSGGRSEPSARLAPVLRSRSVTRRPPSSSSASTAPRAEIEREIDSRREGHDGHLLELVAGRRPARRRARRPRARGRTAAAGCVEVAHRDEAVLVIGEVHAVELVLAGRAPPGGCRPRTRAGRPAGSRRASAGRC